MSLVKLQKENYLTKLKIAKNQTYFLNNGCDFVTNDLYARAQNYV